MNKRNFCLTENELKALFVSSSISNVMDAFLEDKFGEEYVKFRDETISRWLEACRTENEARASGAHTPIITSKPKNYEAAK